jgi:hypothetical protein
MVDLLPIATNGKQAQFTLPQYGAIYPSLQSLGLLIIGVEFYSHVLAAKGKEQSRREPCTGKLFELSNELELES